MKKYFLGFFPDQKNNHKIRKIVGEVGRVFDGQDIDIRWANPDNFHVTLMYLGTNLNFLQKYFKFKKINNLIIPKFNIQLNECELGVSRSYKGLVYLNLKEGGEELRNLVFSLRSFLSNNDVSNYIPHITLGRVSKDLTSEEFRNLASDIKNVNSQLNITDISFTSENLCLVEDDGEKYSYLKKFPTA
jgi:2'-5' RNA ligase